jgi:hypothetical protein
MDLVTLVIGIVILALVAYVIDTWIPMAPPIRTVVRVVFALVIVLWLLRFLGLWSLRA